MSWCDLTPFTLSLTDKPIYAKIHHIFIKTKVSDPYFHGESMQKEVDGIINIK